MPSPSNIVLPGGLVLITGVNGFVGSHIADNLLRLGYKIRGTVRTKEKSAWIKEIMTERHTSAHFDTVLVPDVSRSGVWDEIIKGVDGIVHVATDMSFGTDPNKVITPMINSVRNLLQSAMRASSVKRFVMTSSNRSISNAIVGKAVALDGSMWNETAVEQAWRPPPYTDDRLWDIYAALKTQCEQELWRFNRDEKPGFVINSVLPCFVVGPILHPKQQGSTGKWVMDFWRDPGHFVPLQGFGASWFIDSEDAALLHIAALTQEDVRNERLLGFAELFNFNSWLTVFRQLGPERTWPVDDVTRGHDLCEADSARELQLLGRYGKEAGRASKTA